jgi:hypothetical protein
VPYLQAGLSLEFSYYAACRDAGLDPAADGPVPVPH